MRVDGVVGGDGTVVVVVLAYLRRVGLRSRSNGKILYVKTTDMPRCHLRSSVAVSIVFQNHPSQRKRNPHTIIKSPVASKPFIQFIQSFRTIRPIMLARFRDSISHSRCGHTHTPLSRLIAFLSFSFSRHPDAGPLMTRRPCPSFPMNESIGQQCLQRGQIIYSLTVCIFVAYPVGTIWRVWWR